MNSKLPAMNSLNKIKFEQIGSKKRILLQNNHIISDSNETLKRIKPNEYFEFDGVTLGVCTKGNASLKMNHRKYNLEANMITFISPNTIMSIEEMSDDFFLELIFSSIDYFYSVPLCIEIDTFIKMNEKPTIKLNTDAVQSILNLYYLIIKYHNCNLAHKESVIDSLTSALMFEITSYYKMETDKDALKELSREDNIARHFFSLLIDSFRSEKKLDFYASKLCLTPNYLSFIIKKVTGSSFQKWIQIVLIIDAKNLLKITDFSIAQISDILGFANPSFFGRFFKQHAGTTPLQYRKSL